jgi:hypothetical protein
MAAMVQACDDVDPIVVMKKLEGGTDLGYLSNLAQLALLTHGVLDDAEAAIAAITDPVQRREAQIEYEADTWERANPFLQQLWAQLGGTPQSLDEAFTLAVTL